MRFDTVWLMLIIILMAFGFGSALAGKKQARGGQVRSIGRHSQKRLAVGFGQRGVSWLFSTVIKLENLCV